MKVEEVDQAVTVIPKISDDTELVMMLGGIDNQRIAHNIKVDQHGHVIPSFWSFSVADALILWVIVGLSLFHRRRHV